MCKRGITWLSFFTALVLVGVVSCGKSGEQSGEGTTAEGSRVLARVGEAVITEADMQDALNSILTHQRPQYEGATGRVRLLEELVNRKLITLAAEEIKLDETPEIKTRMADFRERVLTQAYHNYMVESLPKPTEEDMREYYDQNPQSFVIPARINASWIKCATKEEAETAHRRIVNDGEHFGTVARQVTIDDCSRSDGGLLGYFNPTGYVRCIGNNPEFSAKAFELEADDVGPVFEVEGGWAFIKVHEKTTERQEPFSTARERISARLRPKLTDSLLTVELARLRSRFQVETLLNLEDEIEGKSADDLMRLATEVSAPNDKIAYYRALLKLYPQYPRADEAQFMIGFVYSEELRDFDAAKTEYQKVIDQYPDSDILESAYYMLQNMGREQVPPFDPANPEGEGTP